MKVSVYISTIYYWRGTKMKKRLLSLLLVLTMVFMCLPAGIFAEGGDDVIEEVLQVEEPVNEQEQGDPQQGEGTIVIDPAASEIEEPIEEPQPEPVSTSRHTAITDMIFLNIN